MSNTIIYNFGIPVIIGSVGRPTKSDPINTISSWPNNEPGGMSQIVWFDGSDKTPASPAFVGGRWDEGDDTYVEDSIVDIDSRYGTVIEKRQFIGDPSDWNGLIEYTHTLYRHLYIRWIVKYSSNYQVNSGNEKMFYVGGPGGDGADVYIRINNGSQQLYLTNELTGAGFNDIALGVAMVKNVYETYELHYVAESSSGASDGEYHIWKDDVLVLSATSQNWGTGSPGWNHLYFYEYWGGGSDTKIVNDVIRISEIYVSGKN